MKKLQKLSLAAVAVATVLAGSLTPVAHAADALQLYAALDYSTDVAAAFTAKTGIPVNLTALSTGPLLAKMTAEKNNPQLFDSINNSQGQLANGHPTRLGSAFIAAQLLKLLSGL